MPGRRKAGNAEEKHRKDAENAAVLEKKRQLIQYVQNYPVIYDLSHVDHKNNAIKNVIWAEIAELLKEDGKQLQFIKIFIINNCNNV